MLGLWLGRFGFGLGLLDLWGLDCLDCFGGGGVGEAAGGVDVEGFEAVEDDGGGAGELGGGGGVGGGGAGGGEGDGADDEVEEEEEGSGGKPVDH